MNKIKLQLLSIGFSLIVILISNIYYNDNNNNNDDDNIKYYYSELSSSVFINIIVNLPGWNRTNIIDKANLIHTKKNIKKVEYNSSMIISRIGGIDNLGDKSILYEKIKNYKIINDDIYSNHLPETYNLNNTDDCSLFFKKYYNKNKTIIDPNNIKYYWLLKPTKKSQGDGIEIFSINDINFIEKNILNNVDFNIDNNVCNKTMKNFIIQKYIDNLLIIDNKKMELRIYILIPSINPLIILFHDGVIRLTSKNFTMNNWDDKLIHITNVKQQNKYNSNYSDIKQSLKWSTNDFQKYLFKNKLVDSITYYDDIIKPKLKYLIFNIINSSIDDLDKNHGYYHLLGIDFILTNDLNIMVTEVQAKPGLKSDLKAKENIMFNMMTELIEIVTFTNDFKLNNNFIINEKFNYNLKNELFKLIKFFEFISFENNIYF